MPKQYKISLLSFCQTFKFDQLKLTFFPMTLIAKQGIDSSCNIIVINGLQSLETSFAIRFGFAILNQLDQPV